MDNTDPKDRIILALDANSVSEAHDIATQLEEYVGTFKIGIELIYAILNTLVGSKRSDAEEELWQIRALFDLLRGRIFLDTKLHDIPTTVSHASTAIAHMGIEIFNIHCLSGRIAMESARVAIDSIEYPDSACKPHLYGVTILSSLDYKSLVELGIAPVLNIFDPVELVARKKDFIDRLAVYELAHLAEESGMDGVIVSGQEVEMVRLCCGPEFGVIAVGIRPEWAEVNDQKRAVTPAVAINAGADYVVIGRPITNPPSEVGSMSDAAKLILKEVAEAQKSKEAHK
jgi:orotidine-5'-phosphate decarboxylase